MSVDFLREYYEQQEQEREFFARENYYRELAEQIKREDERDAEEQEYFRLEHECMNLKKPVMLGVCDCMPLELTDDEIPF